MAAPLVRIGKSKTTAAVLAARRCLLLGLSVLALPSFSSPALDMWTGTLELQDGLPVLRRCDVTQARYLLQPLKDPEVLDRLPREAMAQGKKVSATLIATYASQPQGHVLKVDAVDNVRTGHSCHLLDALEDL